MEDKSSQGASIDAVMRKYDREANTRTWEGWRQIAVLAYLAMFSVYCIYMTLFSTALPEVRLSLFLGLATLAGFIVYPATRGHARPNHMPLRIHRRSPTRHGPRRASFPSSRTEPRFRFA